MMLLIKAQFLCVTGLAREIDQTEGQGKRGTGDI